MITHGSEKTNMLISLLEELFNFILYVLVFSYIYICMHNMHGWLRAEEGIRSPGPVVCCNVDVDNYVPVLCKSNINSYPLSHFFWPKISIFKIPLT